MLFIDHKTIFFSQGNIYLNIRSRKALLKNFDFLVQKCLEANKINCFVDFCNQKKINKTVPKIIQSVIQQNLTQYPSFLSNIFWHLNGAYKNVSLSKEKEHYLFLHQLKYDVFEKDSHTINNNDIKNNNKYDFEVKYDIANLFKHTPLSLLNEKYINLDYLPIALGTIPANNFDKFKKIYELGGKHLSKKQIYNILSEEIVSTQKAEGWNFIINKDPKILLKEGKYYYSERPILLSFLLNAKFNFEELNQESFMHLVETMNIFKNNQTNDINNKVLIKCLEKTQLENSINKCIFLWAQNFLTKKDIFEKLAEHIFYIENKDKTTYRDTFIHEPFLQKSIKQKQQIENQVIIGQPIAILENVKYVLDRVHTYYSHLYSDIEKSIQEKIKTLNFSEIDSSVIEDMSIKIEQDVDKSSHFKRFKL